MTDEKKKSDLIDTVHHEHDHLGKLFDDIEETFESLATGGLQGARYDEVVESASANLEFALDEMLHHFNQEEEVFFVEIAARFPDKAAEIDGLTEAHERMCEGTRWLQRQIKKPSSVMSGELEAIREAIHDVRVTLDEHTRRENAFFDDVLRSMSSEERQALLDEMRSI